MNDKGSCLVDGVWSDGRKFSRKVASVVGCRVSSCPMQSVTISSF